MKVQFLKDTSKADCGEIPPDTFLVYREGYSLPELSGVEYLEFSKFKATYFNLHSNKFIFVGINRIITPSNRCEMVFDYMQTMTRKIEKISIDREPFVGEPWRLWYHYDMTNTGKFNVPHGYAMETEWKHWFYRDINDCRLSGRNIGQYICEAVSDLDQLCTQFEFGDPKSDNGGFGFGRVKDDDEWYKEAKEYVFSKHNTPKLLINELLKLCNKRYGLGISYDSFRTGKKFVVPDNGVYRFVVEENRRRMDIHNAIVG